MKIVVWLPQSQIYNPVGYGQNQFLTNNSNTQHNVIVWGFRIVYIEGILQ